MAPLREKATLGRRGQFRVECLEGRVLLAEMAAWVGQNNTDLVGRDGRSPDGYQDINIHLTGLDPSRAITRVDVQRQFGGLWTATSNLSSQIVLVRNQDQATGTWATEGDIALEPYFNDPVNTRYELIRLTYSDGSTVAIHDVYSTTAVDVNLRVQGKELGVTWMGQDGPDLTGSGLSVGADGIKDLHLKLSNLLDFRRATDQWRSNFNPDSDSVVVTMPTVDGSTVTWLAGPRPSGLGQSYNNAELILDPADPSRADLYLNPVAGLAAGAEVTVTVAYNRIGKTDASPDLDGEPGQLVAVVATPPDPTLAADAPQGPSLPVSFSGPSAVWSGQDGPNSKTPGFVHVTLSGLPAGWAIADMVLSNNSGQVWTQGDANTARAITVRPLADPTKADLSFAPARDESNALLSVRFRLVDGTVQFVSQFRGGPADVTLRDPAASTESITVDPAYVSQPGQDLNTLVKRYGTIHLKAGTYPLSEPLDLVNSISLVAEPGTVFAFSQANDAPAWSYAIKVRASHTTIDGTALGGLAIRFATPIRWTSDFQMDPAIIGSTYGTHNNGPNPKVDLNFRNLDIAYAPLPGDGDNSTVTNVRLIRSNYDDSGVIANNILLGGPVELWGGPWKVAGNDYRGASEGSAVSPVFAIRDGHDVVIDGNHAHQVDPSGITYAFLLFTGRSSNTIVRNNLIDGGIGRDAANPNEVRINSPELILTEAYYPYFEGQVRVAATATRVLQVSTLRGGPVQSGDVVAILSGPFAGRWVRISQAIDSQNYLLDGDLPAGDYAVSITRGFVNDLYEGNTLDTSSLAKSSSVAFQLVGTHVGTVVRNNLVIGAQPFFISASATERSYPGSTPYPTAWGWSHLPIFDLRIEGNTFRDPVFWTSDGTATGLTRTVAEGTLTVEHNALVRQVTGRLYLTGSVTNNHFIYSDALLAGTSGDITSIRIGDAGAADPGELRLISLGGNTATASGSFTAAGRTVGIRFASPGGAANQILAPVPSLPVPPPAIPTVSGTTRNQDGSDLVGRSSTPGPDGFQDVHIILAGLRTDMAIRTIDIYPYGAGHFQYAMPGLAQDTPGLAPGAWRVGLVRGVEGPARFAAKADIYVQPYMSDDGRSHWDVVVTYLDGTTASLSVYGIVVGDPGLKVNSAPSRMTGVSLGQDHSDVVGSGTTTAPDGYQDIHLVLSGLPSDKAIVQVDVAPYGYGHFQYVAPLAAPLPASHPATPDRDSRYWRAGLVRTAIGLGSYSTIADLYVPSTRVENGILQGTNLANHYDVVVTFADGSVLSTAVWGIVSDPNARVVGLSATSYGQDGHDETGPTSTPVGDGVQDLHIGLTGLRTDLQVSKVEVWATGVGEWTYQGTTYRPAATLVRGATGAGSFAPTGDLYLAPNENFIGTDGSLRPQTLNILVYYSDGSISEQAVVSNVVADPGLLNPVVTSLDQDGHDFARLAPTPGADGNQDVHLVLSNLPTDRPVARVVVRRQGGGVVYQSDESSGSWMAVVVQPRTGPARFASTADIYFEPGPNVIDANASYVIEVYLGDASRPSFLTTATVTANAGLAMPLLLPTTPSPTTTPLTLESSSVTASATVAMASPPAAPGTQISQDSTPATSPSSTSPQPAALTISGRAQSRRIPVGPLGHRRFKAQGGDGSSHKADHRPAVARSAAGPKGTELSNASKPKRGRRG